MASTTATWFRNGVQQSGGYVGCVGWDRNGPFVGRFAFTTPATGASSLSFASSTYSKVEQTGYASMNSFRAAVTTSATANITKVGTDGFAVGGNYWDSPGSMVNDGAMAVQLLPNTTYYLWIYPAESRYGIWRITSVTVAFSGTYGTPGTPSASNGTFGSAVSISISGGTSFATYTVTAACAGRTDTLQTKSATTSLSWEPTVAVYAPLIKNASSATTTITVTTYYGDTSVGVKTKTITMSFRAADVAPSVTMAVSDPTGLATTYGAYVATKSKIQAQLTTTTQYSATVSTYAITANGSSYNTNPATTSEIASASNNTVTGKITDSRGFASNTASQTITILAYTQPQINGFTIHRCQQDGTLDDSGAYMRVDYDVSITALNNVNSKELVVKYKKRVDTTYSSETVTLTTYTQSGSTVIAADTNYTYDVQLELTDDFSTVTISLQLSTTFTTMNFRAGGKGIGVGKVSEIDYLLDLASGWSVRLGSTTLSEADLQTLTISPARLQAVYGIPISGEKVNATIAEIFSAVPAYSTVIIPFIQAGNTERFGTFAGQLPENKYGMFMLEKGVAIAYCRFFGYSDAVSYVGSYTTINDRGFSGWHKLAFQQ